MTAATQTARRGFLALLTGAVAAPGTAAALPAAAATTASAEPVITEAPELIALGERLTSAIATLKIASAAKAEARAVYERLAPVLPAGLIAPRGETRELAEYHSALDGGIVGSRGEAPMVYTARLIRGHLALCEIDGRTGEGRRLHRLLRMARKYQKEVASARALSNFEARESAAIEAAIALHKIALELSRLKPRAHDGVLIFARALMVLDDVLQALGHQPDTGGPAAVIGRTLSDALLAMEGGEA